jgi:hypothetical protein
LPKIEVVEPLFHVRHVSLPSSLRPQE